MLPFFIMVCLKTAQNSQITRDPVLLVEGKQSILHSGFICKRNNISTPSHVYVCKDHIRSELLETEEMGGKNQKVLPPFMVLQNTASSSKNQTSKNTS